MNVLYILRLNL